MSEPRIACDRPSISHLSPPSVAKKISRVPSRTLTSTTALKSHRDFTPNKHSFLVECSSILLLYLLWASRSNGLHPGSL